MKTTWEKIEDAYKLVAEGTTKRVDTVTSLGTVKVYRAGTIIRIDIPEAK